MNQLNKLTSLFMRFPGIGSRQAQRFSYFLLQSHPHFISDLIKTLGLLKSTMKECSLCYSYFENEREDRNICSICSDKNIDTDILMVVAREVDLENVKRAGIYNGRYFVLGGLIPLLDKKQELKIRTKELIDHIEKRADTEGLQEVIFALNANPEGDNTIFYLQKLLKPLADKYKLKVTALGRGLSTGTELEYSDTETIKNAMENRH